MASYFWTELFRGKFLLAEWLTVVYPALDFNHWHLQICLLQTQIYFRISIPIYAAYVWKPVLHEILGYLPLFVTCWHGEIKNEWISMDLQGKQLLWHPLSLPAHWPTLVKKKKLTLQIFAYYKACGHISWRAMSDPKRQVFIFLKIKDLPGCKRILQYQN